MRMMRQVIEVFPHYSKKFLTVSVFLFIRVLVLIAFLSATVLAHLGLKFQILLDMSTLLHGINVVWLWSSGNRAPCGSLPQGLPKLRHRYQSIWNDIGLEALNEAHEFEIGNSEEVWHKLFCNGILVHIRPPSEAEVAPSAALSRMLFLRPKNLRNCRAGYWFALCWALPAYEYPSRLFSACPSYQIPSADPQIPQNALVPGTSAQYRVAKKKTPTY